MRKVKWNCVRIDDGTTVGFPDSASVLYGYGGSEETPFVWPSVVPFASGAVPTPFLILLPPRDGAMVAWPLLGGTR